MAFVYSLYQLVPGRCLYFQYGVGPPVCHAVLTSHGDVDGHTHAVDLQDQIKQLQSSHLFHDSDQILVRNLYFVENL